ncbi:hypothetical protein PLESTM_001589100 [Pleodorina starrii]|nr:hypothetical protein PLESTM_001589100 [Pleodorina starrii]
MLLRHCLRCKPTTSNFRLWSSGTLFTTSQNALVKVISSDDTTTVLSVSLDEPAVEKLGDPTEVSTARPGHTLTPGSALASVSWEAYRRGESDELYHAQWANVTGTLRLQLPFSVRVLRQHNFAAHDLLNTQEMRPWILDVEVATKDWKDSLVQGALRLLAQ